MRRDMLLVHRYSRLALLTLAGTALLGCSGDESAGDLGDHDVIPKVAVPAANGPKLAILTHRTPVYDRPSTKGKVLGTLRAGAKVSRANKPYSKRQCEGGWYPIRPRGFVCAGSHATLETDSVRAQALAEGPNLERPLPYRYARVRSGGAVLYGTLPSAEEQLSAEPKRKHRTAAKPKRLGAGANDVALDDDGYPDGPPVVRPGAAGVDDKGYRQSESFFQFDSEVAASLKTGTSLLGAGPQARKTLVLNRYSAMPLLGKVDIQGPDGTRPFVWLPDGRFIAVDRLDPLLGTPWHGQDLRKTGLPVAFSLRVGVRPWKLEKGAAKSIDDEFEPRTAIALSGRFRTVRGHRYYFAKDEYWVRARDIYLIPKRHKFPEWAVGKKRWVDISLANQTLVAWEGKTPVYATLLSSGRDRLGDANTGDAATPRGVFKISSKQITANIDPREVQNRYTVLEVPWVLELEGAKAAITGAYWLSRMGEARGFHNIGLSPIDARWLWHWDQLRVPNNWQSVNATNTDDSTIVYIHK